MPKFGSVAATDVLY